MLACGGDVGGEAHEGTIIPSLGAAKIPILSFIKG